MSSKASYNLAGGSVEFDMDLSKAHGKVNNNVYATFPKDGHSYCDSGGAAHGCAEFDWTENNGNCRQATTWHSNRDGKDHGGKQYQGSLGKDAHVKVTWSDDASTSHVSIAGHTYEGEGFADVMEKYGLVIYSSQWKGWVPGSCGGDGNLDASTFEVKNLRIVGSVVQGPEPEKCGSPSPPSPPSPPPPPSPSPSSFTKHSGQYWSTADGGASRVYDGSSGSSSDCKSKCLADSACAQFDYSSKKSHCRTYHGIAVLHASSDGYDAYEKTSVSIVV